MGDAKVPWDVWIAPMLLWGLFLLAFFLLHLGMAHVVRRRWTDIEHLRYPVVMPVVELIGAEKNSEGSIWKSKLMWGGFAVAFLMIFYAEFLQERFKVLPQMSYSYGTWRVYSPLWSIMKGTGLGKTMDVWDGGFAVDFWGFNPKYIGLAYLIPQEVIVTQILAHILRIIPNAILQNSGVLPTLPVRVLTLWNIVAFGGVFALGVFLIYQLKSDIVRVFTGLFTKNDDPEDGMKDSTAFLFIVGSFIFILAFLLIFLHYQLWRALVYLFLYMILVLGFTRMRAEGGFSVQKPGPSNYHLGVQVDLIASFFGRKAIGPLGATGAAILANHDSNERNSFAADILETWKFADQRGISKKAITKSLILAFLLTVVIFFITTLSYLYKNGITNTKTAFLYMGLHFGSLNTYVTPTRATQMLSNPQPVIIGAFLFGAFLTGLNGWLRMNFAQWTVSSVGLTWGFLYDYTAIGSFIPVAILRSIIVRYGGYRLYSKLRPFFVGQIWGWAVASIITTIANSAVAFIR